MRICISLLLLVACAACSLLSEKMYEGPERSRSELGSLSSIADYPKDQLNLQIIKIDGKDVLGPKTAEFLMSPGTHTVTVRVLKDFKPGFGIGAVSTWKETTGDIKLEVSQGHTYIPNYQLSGDTIRMFFTDAGLNFPQECLPLYRRANEGSNPGFAVYRTPKKCGRTGQ